MGWGGLAEPFEPLGICIGIPAREIPMGLNHPDSRTSCPPMVEPRSAVGIGSLLVGAFCVEPM